MTARTHHARTVSRLGESWGVCDASTACAWSGPHRRRWRVEVGPLGALGIAVTLVTGCLGVVHVIATLLEGAP